MAGLTVNLSQVEPFFTKYQRRIRGEGYVESRSLYLSASLCKKLINMCITVAPDDKVFKTLQIRMPTNTEAAKLKASGTNAVVFLGWSNKTLYGINQDGTYACLTHSTDDDPEFGLVVHYVINVSKLFKRFQQTGDSIFFFK